ncbi:MAG: sulfite exporter TauE/SafE family protein [Gemmatimonadota bacterium]|nr:sulfite exporter TauE/SafE family protein [Gemmatimonadota bacterium]
MVASVFVAALLGSAHCAAMCGAFACTAADVDVRGSGRFRASLAYHGTRLAGYLLLGLIAGAVGAGIDSAVVLRGIARPAAFFAGLVLIGWGASRALALAGIRVPRLPSVGSGLVITRLLRRGADRSPMARAALLGAVAPLLPCGWLWAFVAPAAATGSPWQGAVVMAAFWAGTVPALAVVAIGAQRALGPARRLLPAVTAAAMLLIGTMTIVRAVRGEVPVAHPQAHAQTPTPEIAGGQLGR